MELSKPIARPHMIFAPPDRADWPVWRQDLLRWRDETRRAIGYEGTLYQRSDFEWVAACFAWCHVMMWDLLVANPEEAAYTIDAFLDRAEAEYGGYDLLILWPDYPRIGIDRRSQFDHYRDLPGGVEGLRALSDGCHRRGVKVFVAFKPWDTETRREPGAEVEANVELVKAIDADGMFLDVMSLARGEHRRLLDEARPGVVFAPELAFQMGVEAVEQHHMELLWSIEPMSLEVAVPPVLRNKWFERRHQLFIGGRRETNDHSDELHTAWMNGTGVFIWDNCFALQIPWSPRDKTLLRAMLPIQRKFASLFSGEGWTPLVDTLHGSVYASRWDDTRTTLWTLINASEQQVDGPLLTVDLVEGARYFDLIRGQEITPNWQDGHACISGFILQRGIGCIAAFWEGQLVPGFDDFLRRQQATHRRADYRLSVVKPVETLTPPGQTCLYPHHSAPPGMAILPGCSYTQNVAFRLRECMLYEAPGVDVQLYLQHGHAQHKFTRLVSLNPYAVDLTPVTNAQYAEFLAASGYWPRHARNFLNHWQDGKPLPGEEDHPVVYVDLKDARAYARWAGKRLPTEEEWQYAAEGPDRFAYPWGDSFEVGRCNGGETHHTTPVTAFPSGASPFGCLDLCGNVWELTESERSDGRTRFCILKGGSHIHLTGSGWYFDGGPQSNSFVAKYILFWPGLDRSEAVGFRCAADLERP